jgi:hypothetical protein
MKKNATMMITGNSIAELRSNLDALEAAINSGARMGVGGNSLEDVKTGYHALCDTVGYGYGEPIVECEEVEEECCCCDYSPTSPLAARMIQTIIQQYI